MIQLLHHHPLHSILFLHPFPARSNTDAVNREEDRTATFLIVGGFNVLHREWLASVSPTDAHGRASLYFSSISVCSQLVSDSVHQSGNSLVLVYNDVAARVKVATKVTLCPSDHASISSQLDLRQKMTT